MILADNGMEFLSPSLIETSSYVGHRTRLYYCDRFHLVKRVVLRKIMWNCEKCYQKELPLTHEIIRNSLYINYTKKFILSML